MRNVTIKGLLAHKLRLALTALAIVLGVTFISGTFVLTDTLNNTFTVLFGNIYQKIDFQVRGVAQLGSGANAVRNELPESLLATVRGVPGVQAAQGEVGGYAQFVAQDGKAIQTSGAPTLGVSFDPDQQISSLHLVAGGPPVTADDVVMDAGTAQKYGFTVGQRVRILFAGPPRTFTITGIAQFGSANNLAGATLAAFTLPTAQAVLQEVGQLDDINVVAAPGASKPAVQRDIASALPPGVEVVTGQTVVNEQTSSVSQALSFFSTALLVFAFISLFVGGFTIFNTFSIIVGQRTRELALLRIVGASRRQVFRSVLAEAAIVGLVSSAIGLGLGVLAALGLEALLRGFGITLPTGSLVFEPRTVLVGLAVGVGVTVVAAVGPARNAVRIPPVAALDDRQSGGGVSMRRRFVWGTAVALVGVVMLAIGLAKPAIALVGVGAVGIFVGVAMLSPAIARPLSSVIGRPLARVLGEPGKLGRENSMRSPRRTAQTASALMVGLALVAAMSVFGASVSKSATSSVDQAISADLIVSTTSGSGQLSQSVPATASAVPGVTAATTVYRSQFDVQNSLATLTAVSTQHLADTLILRMTAGSPAALAQGELLIDSTTAKSKNLSVGDTVPVKFAETGSSTLRIGGIYEANALIGSYLVSAPFFLSRFSNPSLGALLLRTNGSAAVDTAVTHALAPFPNLQVQTRAQFEQAQVASVNQILGLVYALLALAVLIALIGIVNTLMLSVFERTREIGLLRAVGMKRRQVRTMIRSEAVILAIFGAIIGIVIGTAMGIALVSSLKQQGITDTVVPASRLVEFLVLAALLGLIAASWPARRAAKLDVLAAIAAELSPPLIRGSSSSSSVAPASSSGMKPGLAGLFGGMSIELGKVGIWRHPSGLTPEVVAEVEALGYGAIWVGGSPPGDLGVVDQLLDTTDHIAVATGIVNVWKDDAATVGASYHRITARHPGRFLLGLGIGHPEATQEYQQPYAKLVSYLDQLDELKVPAGGRLLAALGPKVLRLAAERAAGAHPYLVTPEHTRQARQILGDGPLLAPEQKVVLETDPERARAIGRPRVQNPYLGLTNYLSNLRRLGWTDADFADGGSDALIDALAVHGDAAAIARGVTAHLDAGADHVAVQVLNPDPLPALRALADQLQLARR